METSNKKGMKDSEAKPHRPEPEEQGGMPQYRLCPLRKHREDRNPKYHEENEHDDARFLAAHAQKTVE
jgi:hypothetical protein